MRDDRDGQELDAMTGNQRRPGFRLPWSTEPADAEPAAEANAAPETAAAEKGDGPQARADAVFGTEAPAPAEAAAEPRAAAPATDDATSSSEAPGSAEAGAPPADAFLRELVDAMRTVADNARDANLAELREQADARTQRLSAESESRTAALRSVADADVAGVGDWAAAEAERIRVEAERRVAERKSRLEEELATETKRATDERTAMRARLDDYERELTAFHAQLSEIGDPAAFAAAAKRIPSPPLLGPAVSTPASSGTESTQGTASPSAAQAPAEAATPASAPEAAAGDTAPAAAPNAGPESGNGSLAQRLAELDAVLEPPRFTPETQPPATEAPNAEPAAATAAPASEPAAATAPSTVATAAPETDAAPQSTAVVVRGLSSFGAITGFRQSLAAADGVENVNLSLGPTGEFLYRATHAAGFDLADAIRSIEGDQAAIEKDDSGTLHVTINRGR